RHLSFLYKRPKGLYDGRVRSHHAFHLELLAWKCATEIYVSHIAVDFLLITALEQELLALLDCLPAHQKLDPIAEDIHTYYEATIAGTLPSGREISYRVIAAGIMHMGRVDAAT